MYFWKQEDDSLNLWRHLARHSEILTTYRASCVTFWLLSKPQELHTVKGRLIRHTSSALFWPSCPCHSITSLTTLHNDFKSIKAYFRPTWQLPLLWSVWEPFFNVISTDLIILLAKFMYCTYLIPRRNYHANLPGGIPNKRHRLELYPQGMHSIKRQSICRDLVGLLGSLKRSLQFFSKALLTTCEKFIKIYVTIWARLLYQNKTEQDCIPVGCIPPACWPYLPACSAPGGVPDPGGVYLLGGLSAPGGVPGLGGLLPGGVCWGVYLVWGVSAQGCTCSGGCTWSGGCTCSRGVSGLGGVCSRGRTWSRGGCLLQGGVPGLEGCLLPGGGAPGSGACQVLPLWTESQTPVKT